jgi:uncharacterized protein YfkK (UPF0435 family)
VTDAIDQLLADWKQKLQVVNQNLLDLQDLPTYQRLTLVNLTGITAQRVGPALSTINDLFQNFDLLAETIDKASKLRQQRSGFFVSVPQVEEIKKILTEPSIQLSVVQTPLAQRGLLSGTEKVSAIAPIKLLEAMTRNFSMARDLVLEVDAAWTRLDLTLENIQKQVVSLEKIATSLGQTSVSELIQVRGVITSLRERVEQDPLGVTSDIEQQIQPLLAQVKTALEQVVKQQTEVREKMAISRKMLEQLQELHLKAVPVFAESQEKVTDHAVLQQPLAPTEIEAIAQWLGRLSTKLAEGLIAPVTVGLNNWIHKAQEYLTVTQQVYTSHSNLLQTRQELRGRLDALQAKALARGLAEDATLSAIAQAAKELLYQRPTPLNRAIALVSQYEKTLNNRL